MALTPETTKATAAVSEGKQLEEVKQLIQDTNDWIPSFILPYLDKFESHPWLVAGSYLIIGFCFALLVRGLLSFFVRRIITKNHSRQINTIYDQLLKITGRIIFLTLVYLNIVVAVGLSPIPENPALILKRLVLTFLLISWLSFGLKTSKFVLELLNQQKDVRFLERRTIPLFNITMQILIFATVCYLLILVWGKDPTVWLASAGIIGIAVGFAAKDTLANLFAGVFIIADAPYKLGDYIVLDAGQRGIVSHVGIRSTRILTRDDNEVTVPNSIMGNTIVINESGGPYEKSRIRIPIGVAYGSDADQVNAVLLDVVSEFPDDICSYPPARVRMRGFGASSIDFELLCWIDNPSQRGKVKHDLLMTIYKRFNSEGLEIPYQKQDLYIKEMPKDLVDKADK